MVCLNSKEDEEEDEEVANQNIMNSIMVMVKSSP